MSRGQADTVYGGPAVRPGPYTYTSPPSRGEQDRLALALGSVDAPADALREISVSTLFPQIELFPDRTGFGPAPVTVTDCVRLPRNFVDAHHDFSGSPAGYAGTSTPALGGW